MIYTVIVTDCDPTQEGAQVLLKVDPHKSKLDAYSDCRHFAKLYEGFGSVYDSTGESLFEIDWTDKE